MAIVRAVSVVVGVLGAAFALAACGGEVGGTTTLATEAPRPKATTTTEKPSTAKEQATTEKAATTEKTTTAEKTTTKPQGGGKGSAAAEQGKEVFTANGCGACHTLAAAGTTASVGPDLDETLPGKSTSYIRESIVDPNATVAPGYSAGIMPPTFGSTLSSSEIEALVTFLAQSVG